MTAVKSTRHRFAGSTVVVTGGAGGIGQAVCEGFIGEGARVVSVDVAAGDYQADVTDQESMNEVMRNVHDRWGGPDVLVTLAGGSLGTPRDLTDFTTDDVDLVLDVNVKGTLYACRSALPYMSAGCAIVTCASIGGRQPSPVTGVPYAMAKAAVGGLTRRLAAEVGPAGVRVNAVAPGLFLTQRLRGMFEAMSQEEREGVTGAIALRRMPELEELVDPILFLSSREAGFITGVTLDVNGGRFMPL